MRPRPCAARARTVASGSREGSGYSQPARAKPPSAPAGAVASSPAWTRARRRRTASRISGTAARRSCGIGGRDVVGRHLRAGEQAVEVGEHRTDVLDRVGRELGLELPAARLPAAELRVMVGAVEAAVGTVDLLEEIGAPDRPGHVDRLRGVHRALDRRALEDAYLEADAALGALLALTRVRVDEVQVADHHAHLLERERIQHAPNATRSTRGVARDCGPRRGREEPGSARSRAVGGARAVGAARGRPARRPVPQAHRAAVARAGDGVRRRRVDQRDHDRSRRRGLPRGRARADGRRA